MLRLTGRISTTFHFYNDVKSHFNKGLRERLRMKEGTVKWYSEKKGYGFIQTENHGDVFMHSKSIEDHGHFGLQKLDRVSFEIKETPRGLQAVRVKVL
jgi:CspA family cold shock protein